MCDELNKAFKPFEKFSFEDILKKYGMTRDMLYDKEKNQLTLLGGLFVITCTLEYLFGGTHGQFG